MQLPERLPPCKATCLSGASNLQSTHSVPLATQVVANGSCHSIEGIKLEELGLKTGEAKLLVRGNLLGAAQDASIILTDFPVAILQPMFRALPALEHAAPAVAASGDCRRHAEMPCCRPCISSPSAHCNDERVAPGLASGGICMAEMGALSACKEARIPQKAQAGCGVWQTAG